jgi:peptide/nickel transport system ATP-binding protein/oligopeptide transport system ATP-binding protein
MYLGNIVEQGSTEAVFGEPLHPYTQALLDAHPVPDPTIRKERVLLEGTIPSALNPPSGCKFHTRCKKCMEICKEKEPEKIQLTANHSVYCHLYAGMEESSKKED